MQYYLFEIDGKWVYDELESKQNILEHRQMYKLGDDIFKAFKIHHLDIAKTTGQSLRYNFKQYPTIYRVDYDNEKKSLSFEIVVSPKNPTKYQDPRKGEIELRSGQYLYDPERNLLWEIISVNGTEYCLDVNLRYEILDSSYVLSSPFEAKPTRLYMSWLYERSFCMFEGMEFIDYAHRHGILK